MTEKGNPNVKIEELILHIELLQSGHISDILAQFSRQKRPIARIATHESEVTFQTMQLSVGQSCECV